jgi:transcriptional regulator with XRE-family HTH domain
MTVSGADGKVDKGLRMVIAEGVRMARVRQRLSQEAVADSAGVSPRGMVRLERGVPVNISTAEKVVNALGLVVTVTESAA